MSTGNISTTSVGSAETVRPSSVLLPRRIEENRHTQGNKPPVWSLNSSTDPSVLTPLQTKCDRHGRPNGVCCKELKDEDDRQLVDPDVVRDVYVVYFEKFVTSFMLTFWLTTRV